MQIDAQSAKASLDDIDAIVARVKQSSFYRGASVLIMIWGVLVACGYVASFVIPHQASVVWIAVDVLGLLATVAMALRYRRQGIDFDWRIVIALLLFFAVGAMCTRLGHFGPRELSAFWPILFMFGYALAGLWLGSAFTILGIAVAVLTFVGYLWIGDLFNLYLALVDGGGLLFAGLWMRRA